MILVISSTNRPKSFTRKVADHYYSLLQERNIESELLYLEDLPSGFFDAAVYAKKEGEVRNLIDTKLAPAKKFVFIVPEYNGSFPGILKLMIDTVEIKKCFHGKKAGIVGVSSGRSGNLRGIDHLMSVLNHVRVQLMPNQPKLSSIESGIGEDGDLIGDYETRIKKHVEDIAAF
ncbi:MAG: NAD(P)H-dependent oxidoreductase [Bacteroidia bacterium]|nr:NAD(P)H-dependent oxidoreductase [Bacteroidia bacterium]